MKKLLAALCLGAVLTVAIPTLLAPAAAAQTVSRTLTGDWRGVFFSGADNQATEFDATLRELDGIVSGTTLEQNMFGDASSYWLFANIIGRVNGQSITWSKTYDGTAGQTHTVTYEGRFLSDRRIEGTWRVGASTGQFEMAR